MNDKRTNQTEPDRDGQTLLSETARAADAIGRASDEPPPPKKRSDEESISLFWRVFGGTILSIAALVGITLFNNMTASISELRADVARMNEAKAEFAKKDEVNAVRIVTTTHAGYRAEIDSLKERMSKSRGELDDARKELSGKLDALGKEQLAASDLAKKDMAALDGLKERVIALTVELKAARDDLAKVRGDVDKNQAAAVERRDRRDAQVKQIDETLKDLAKTMQETREKVARLEGQQGPPKTPPSGKN